MNDGVSVSDSHNTILVNTGRGNFLMPPIPPNDQIKNPNKTTLQASCQCDHQQSYHYFIRQHPDSSMSLLKRSDQSKLQSQTRGLPAKKNSGRPGKRR